jgi:histidinol dehydrogenase
VLIVADGRARPDLVAADLLSQAEHDPLAAAILVTPSAALAARVARELKRSSASSHARASPGARSPATARRS